MARSREGPEADLQRLYEYDDLIQRRLKPLVAERQATLEATTGELAEWREQLAVLEALLAGRRTAAGSASAVAALVPPLDLLVDVGGGFQLQGRVEAVDRLVLDVGCGVHVELTPEEAVTACKRRIAFLERREADRREAVVTTVADLCMAGAAFNAVMASLSAGASAKR